MLSLQIANAVYSVKKQIVFVRRNYPLVCDVSFFYTRH